MRMLDRSGLSAGAGTCLSASPREASPTRAEASGNFVAERGLNFGDFWKRLRSLPALRSEVERLEQWAKIPPWSTVGR